MDLKEKLYLSTIGEKADIYAEKYGLGLEMAEFCTAVNMDTEDNEWRKAFCDRFKHSDRHILHAPFSDLSPAAIDPYVRKVTMYRYEQAYEIARANGINKMIVHSGFLPNVHYDVWFIEQSVAFWKEFMTDKPENLTVCIENVLDNDPSVLREVFSGISDSRVRFCFDGGHALVASDVSLESWAKSLMPYIGHVHVHDNLGDHDYHLPVGDGIAGWETLLPMIIRNCPEATFTLENLQYEKSIDWLISHDYISGETL